MPPPGIAAGPFEVHSRAMRRPGGCQHTRSKADWDWMQGGSRWPTRSGGVGASDAIGMEPPPNERTSGFFGRPKRPVHGAGPPAGERRRIAALGHDRGEGEPGEFLVASDPHEPAGAGRGCTSAEAEIDLRASTRPYGKGEFDAPNTDPEIALG